MMRLGGLRSETQGLLPLGNCLVNFASIIQNLPLFKMITGLL